MAILFSLSKLNVLLFFRANLELSFLVTIFALFILVPVYNKLADSNDFISSATMKNYSVFDKLTLSNAIDDFDVTSMVILMTYLFCVFAYYLLYIFCSQMSSYEFYSANIFID